MMTKKILTIIVLLGFSLTLMDLGLWAGAAGIQPGANVRQEKTEKKDEEKKEEEKNKKEKEKKLKRVWTDKDLKEIRKEKLNITEVPPDPDEKKKKKVKKKVSDPPDLVKNTTEGEKFDPRKTEKYWRDRKRALVDKIKKNEEEIKNMQVKLFQLQGQLNGTDIYSQRVQIEQEIRDTNKKLENYKIGLERMKKDLEDLKDEARKAGALPGWLRD